MPPPPHINKNNSWGAQQQQKANKQPPIPFKTTSHAPGILPFYTELASKGQKYISVQKEKLANINKSHVQLLGTLQQLEIGKIAMTAESNKMRT